MKIQLIHPMAQVPARQTSGAAGYDLYLPSDIIVHPGRQILPLGFKLEIPESIFGTITPRSGFSAKGMTGVEIPCGMKSELIRDYIKSAELGRYDIDVLIGRIDSDYRGEVGVIVVSREKNDIALLSCTRIAQMIFQKYEKMEFTEVSGLSETERGEGGFQSTGA